LSHVLAYPTESIGKIMKRRVIKVTPDDTLHHAAELMMELRIGSVVVVEDERPIGIITERDCVRLMAKGRGAETKAREVMTTPLITCESNKKVTEAFVTMAENEINHLPITENGKLVGIVASRDLLAETLV
jgi:CBS domain-containing protein